MIRSNRVSVAARAFAIAATLGVALALRDPVALQGTLMLAAVAAIASAATISLPLNERATLLAEATVASLVVGMALPEGVVLLPYLVVPSLLAGLAIGAWHVVTVLSLEVLAVGSLAMISGDYSQTETLIEVLAPWLVTTLGVGLIGARLRHMGTMVQQSDGPYESARRLLSQLRTVARQLSSGLDTVSIATQVLQEVHESIGDARAALFLRTEGGVLTPAAFRGHGARDIAIPTEIEIHNASANGVPIQQVRASGIASQRNRVILPLRLDSRLIGAVVSDSQDPAPEGHVHSLMSALDGHALRLEAALAFDDIRTWATMDERQRLAREIHDGVAQEIASLGYAVDDLFAGSTSEGQRRRLQQLRGELTRIVSELRLSIFDLRSEVSGGLGPALADYVREVGARSGLKVHLTLDVTPVRLRPEVETELMRIAQEAVTNARKHAQAQNLWLECFIDAPRARLVIADDGRGIGRGRSDSFGVEIMRERASRIGAQLQLSGPREGVSKTGTTVTVTVGGHAAPDQWSSTRKENVQ